MQTLREEVRHNAAAFRKDIARLLEQSRAGLSEDESVWNEMYEAAVTLQAWRVGVLEQTLKREALAFYTEAQNDSLSALTLALNGLWRPALQSLRSLIEGVEGALYYADHPVE